MADTTQINPALTGNENATVVNEQILSVTPSGLKTLCNPYVIVNGHIHTGCILFGKYLVMEQLPVATGEADLFLCEFEHQQFVAKVYRRVVSIKKEVTQQLQELDSPYVAKLYESGELDGIAVEILPYYSRGSLQGKRFTYEQLRDYIIPCLLEGLKALHDRHILHKDLKPANIMITDDQQSVSIIDFGISSVTETGNTIVLTRTGMTPEYAAPETFKGLFSTNADYYSLGISLYELFCGRTPYHRMSAEEIEQYHAVQRIPFPQDMPQPLQDLIKALTYYDISGRRDKDNPNRRWGYEEVRNWLDGVPQTIPGEGVQRRILEPYHFAGNDYTNRTELVHAMIENWNEGKKQLFRGLLSGYFRLYDPPACQICQAAETEATHLSGQDDLIFFKTAYALDPKNTSFFWKGKVFAGLSAFGRELLEKLRQDDRSMNDLLDSIFKNGVLSQYVSLQEPNNVAMYNALLGLETAYRTHKNVRERKLTLYLTAYMLSGQYVLSIAGQDFHTLEELTGYMKKLLGKNNEHLDQFRAFCHKLVDAHDQLMPSLEAWLIALGKQDAIADWKNAMADPG